MCCRGISREREKEGALKSGVPEQQGPLLYGYKYVDSHSTGVLKSKPMKKLGAMASKGTDGFKKEEKH